MREPALALPALAYLRERKSAPPLRGAFIGCCIWLGFCAASGARAAGALVRDGGRAAGGAGATLLRGWRADGGGAGTMALRGDAPQSPLARRPRAELGPPRRDPRAPLVAGRA